MTDAASRPPRWLLAAILLLALGLRLPGFTESLWFDELFTSDLMVGDLFVLLKSLHGDIHPPLYFVFMHFWNALFGDSEIALRLPPLLCGLATIALAAALGRAVSGRGAGLAAAFLLAVSPVHVWYSQEARPYAANMLFVTLASLAFFELWRRGARTRWTVLFFCGLAGTALTHYYTTSFVGAFFVLALVSRHPARRAVLWSCVLVGAAVALYAAVRLSFSEVLTAKFYLRAFGLAELWELFFEWFLSGNGLTPLDVPREPGLVAALRVLQALAVLVVLRALRRLLGRRDDPEAPPGFHLPVLVLTLPAFLLLLTLLGFDRTYIERSAVPALPLFAVLLGVGLSGFGPRGSRLAAAATAVAAAGVLAAFFAHRGHWTVYKPNPDWRGAADYLGREIDAAGERRVVMSFYSAPLALTYYDPRIQEARAFVRPEAKLERLLRAIERVFGTEGFPGGPLADFVEARYAEYEGWLDRRRQEARALVVPLAPGALEQAPDGWSSEVFYLIGLASQRGAAEVQALLADPRVEVLDERAFPQLVLYKLRRSE